MNKGFLSINMGGRLYVLDRPLVMGIMNVTPDSFFEGSRVQEEDAIRERVRACLQEGADIIDVGACSTRPGSEMVSEREEMARLRAGLEVLRQESSEIPVSIDTFRADVARMCVEEYGADMINDIASGEMDKGMFAMMSRLQVPYIAMHMVGTPETMQGNCQYEEGIIESMIGYFSDKVRRLQALGVKDVILDPGLGFSKTLEQNYQVLAHLDDFGIFGLPLLVGLSRKSMIYKRLGCSSSEALTGTIALNMAALERGADILRVHDVAQARETVELFCALREGSGQ